MALVGDVLQSSREIIPDPCATLATPSLGTISVVAAVGSTLTATSYYVKVTQLTQWGESIASSESTAQVVGADQGIQVAGTLLPGATKVRAYFGTATGAQNQYQESSSLPFTISTNGTGGSVPVLNGAWLPDTDGGFATAATLYRWLNEGLKVAARVAGGIKDMSGVKTTSGVAMYALTSEQWLKITNAWFDGYEIGLGDQRDVYRRAAISGLPGNLTVQKVSDQTVMELWPQPNRTGLSTTLNGGITATATSLVLASVTNLIPFGIIQIDSEKIYYGSVNTATLTLSGLIRGVGGTVPASHLTAAAVTELNLFFSGYRMPETYSVGAANNTLTVPAGWEALLPAYIRSKAMEAEQDYQGAKQLRQQFEQEIMSLVKASKPAAGPRQVGGRHGVEIVQGGLGGGLIVR